MSKIIDIYGHHASYDEPYYLDNSFIGRAIVKDDKTFEGIAEPYYEDGSKFLIFGNMGLGYVNTYVIGSDSFPRLYKGIKDGNKFYGASYVTDGCFDLAIGECKMTLQSADKTREVTAGEEKSIMHQVKLVKACLTDRQRELYEKVVANIYGDTMKTK